MFPIDLLGNLVAVEYETEVYTGVVLPDWKKALRGKVLAVGPGLPLSHDLKEVAPMECQVGDTVIFGAAVGMESVINGRSIRIMRDTDVDCAW